MLSQAHALERLLIPAFFSAVFLHSVFQKTLYNYVLFYRISQKFSELEFSLQKEFSYDFF